MSLCVRHQGKTIASSKSFETGSSRDNNSSQAGRHIGCFAKTTYTIELILGGIGSTGSALNEPD